ncbi:MAG: GTPase domain-containing protein [Actinomycetota bacterium]
MLDGTVPSAPRRAPAGPVDPDATTIRVVFDGAPYAGKTTAARTLAGAIDAEVTTPEASPSGRTLWFDWLCYSAGHDAGRALRVELVTVPGQTELHERRRSLIAWGDVVVFYADTSEANFRDSVTAFDRLRSELATTQTPVIIVANKRDLADALTIDHVRNALGLGPEDVLIEAIASTGSGIRESFIYAVRAAIDHSGGRVEESSADGLLAELQALELPSSQEHVERVHAEVDQSEVDQSEVQAAPTVRGVIRPILNRAAITPGRGIAILGEHWEILVAVAEGADRLPRTDDPSEAAALAQLLEWGLISGETLAPSEAPTLNPVAVQPIPGDAPEPVELVPAAVPSYAGATTAPAPAPQTIRF